jgi:hypothetical protein
MHLRDHKVLHVSHEGGDGMELRDHKILYIQTHEESSDHRPSPKSNASPRIKVPVLTYHTPILH